MCAIASTTCFLTFFFFTSAIKDLPLDRTTRALTGTRIRASTLAAKRQTTSVTDTTVGAEVHKTFDIHGRFTPQITFNRKCRNSGSELRNLGLRQIFDRHARCYAGRFEGNGRKPPRDSAAVRTCTTRNCGGQLRPFMRYCPLCKQKPRRPWSHPELSDRCPRCRWAVSRDYWHFCPWCARREPRAGTFKKPRTRRS